MMIGTILSLWQGVLGGGSDIAGPTIPSDALYDDDGTTALMDDDDTTYLTE